jgi:hypothetical protein
VGTWGKRIILDIIEDTQIEIQEYYGLLNELKMGARSKVPEKPEILILNDTLKMLNVPIWNGGLMDQPYLTTLLLITAKQTAEMMEHIQDAFNNGQGSR